MDAGIDPRGAVSLALLDAAAYERLAALSGETATARTACPGEVLVSEAVADGRTFPSIYVYSVSLPSAAAGWPTGGLEADKSSRQW
jgi:hypothetical protein